MEDGGDSPHADVDGAISEGPFLHLGGVKWAVDGDC
jgi:hypothetical protein